MPDRTFTQHDTTPPLEVTLSADGQPVNLSTATEVKLIMKTATVLVTGVMTKDPDQATNPGKATYAWATGDTDAQGTYRTQFQVTWGDGKIQTFPNSGYKEIVIQEDLG